MNRKDIMQAIKELARCQGYYSRMYNELLIMEKTFPDKYDAYMGYLESQKFADRIDMVLFLES